MILFGIVFLTPCCIYTHTQSHRLHCLGWEAPLSLWYFALLLIANENQISSKHKSTVSKIEPRLSIWNFFRAHMSKRPAPVWSHTHTQYTRPHAHANIPLCSGTAILPSVIDMRGMLTCLFELEPFDCIRYSSSSVMFTMMSWWQWCRQTLEAGESWSGSYLRTAVRKS